MTEAMLRNRRILIVEDVYMLADDLGRMVERAGGIVLGPVPRLADALALIAAGTAIDLALLDVNLQGDMVYAAADELIARGVPVLFVSGYDRQALPARFAGVPLITKPLALDRLAALLAAELAAAA